jgi:hypothetical protein
MATYNTAFGSLPGYNEMLGTTNTTGGGQQQTYNPQGQGQTQQRQATPPRAAQTFAQLQQQGMARPAPAAPQAQQFQQFGGSQQAQQTRQRLQQQLEQFGQTPSRFDTQAFQQIRSAQQANLQSEFQEQQRQLNEDLARRGLSSSTIGEVGLSRLAGAQSRALADLDARLLQQAAETQAADRAQLLAEGRGFAELAAAQDLQQFEANRVGQAAQFEQQLRGAEFGQRQLESGAEQAFRAAQAEQGGGQFEIEQGLRQVLGLGGLGLQERQQTAQERQFGQAQAEQQRQFDIQQALQQQLGLGNLSLEQQRVAAQQQQFGQSLEEQRAQRLQQFGVSQQEIGLRAQQLQQDAALQGRQLSIQEAQNAASNTIERERIAQQAQQFGLNLNEQQAERAQRFGLSGQELALRAQEVQQRGALEGRQLTLQEAQNLAQNALEQQRITQQASQFGLRLSEDRESRLSQLGISQQQVALEQQRIANQAGQFGAQLSFDQARTQAQNNLEQQRINEAIATRQTGVQESALERALRIQLQASEQGFQRGESALERTLRETLQGRDIGFQRERMAIETLIANAIAAGKLQPTTTTTVNAPTTVSTSTQSGQQQSGFAPGQTIYDSQGNAYTWDGTRLVPLPRTSD